MTNVRSGTWMMTGNGIMHNGIAIVDEYGLNLDRLRVRLASCQEEINPKISTFVKFTHSNDKIINLLPKQSKIKDRFD